jgi:hypothetical protein
MYNTIHYNNNHTKIKHKQGIIWKIDSTLIAEWQFCISQLFPRLKQFKRGTPS